MERGWKWLDLEGQYQRLGSVRVSQTFVLSDWGGGGWLINAADFIQALIFYIYTTASIPVLSDNTD